MTRLGRALRAVLAQRFGRRPRDDSAVRELRSFDPLEGRGRFLRLLIDLTDRCNLKCVMCHFSLPGHVQGRDEIPLEALRRIAPGLLPYVGQLGLSCATEPWMFPDFPNVLRLAHEHGIPHVYYVTNATLLTEEAIEVTLRCGVTQVAISLDGATQGTFEAIRRNASFERVLENVRRLRDRKRELGTDVPRLQFNITLLRSNVEELEDWVRLVAELGAAEIDVRHVVPFEGLATCEQTLDAHKELTNRALGRARALAAELGLDVVGCPEDFELTPPPAPEARAPAPESGADAAPPPESHLREACRAPWEMALVHPDGGVVPCTNWFSHELMGNVLEQPFAEIWNGPRYRRLREELLSNQLGKNCRVCPAMGCGSVDREESFQPRKV